MQQTLVIYLHWLPICPFQLGTREQEAVGRREHWTPWEDPVGEKINMNLYQTHIHSHQPPSSWEHVPCFQERLLYPGELRFCRNLDSDGNQWLISWSGRRLLCARYKSRAGYLPFYRVKNTSCQERVMQALIHICTLNPTFSLNLIM